MELRLKLKGKDKTFKSQLITFKRFREATNILNRYAKDEFLGNDYPESDMEEAVALISDYFGVKPEEFEGGFLVEDSSTFFIFFLSVLQNIQLNDGKRQVETDSEGK